VFLRSRPTWIAVASRKPSEATRTYGKSIENIPDHNVVELIVANFYWYDHVVVDDITLMQSVGPAHQNAPGRYGYQNWPASQEHKFQSMF